MANPKRTDEPVKLTKRTVDAAKPRSQEYMRWDTEIKGFGLKILTSGRKTYLLKYRNRSGVPRKPQIGVHGDITPDKARDIAKDWRADIAKGGDPSLQRRESRQAGPISVNSGGRRNRPICRT